VSRERRGDGGAGTSAPALAAPPPGPALLAAVGSLRPVRTRAPGLALLAVLAAAAVHPLVVTATLGPRRDLPYLPPAWVAAAALVWAAAAALLFARALLPRRGDVLPDTARAGRAAAAAAVLLVAFGAFATVNAEGRTAIPASFVDGWLHCTAFTAKVLGPVLLVGLFALRRLHPIGGWRVGAALGAAAGAVAGLSLHFLCALGGGLHVGLAHAGGVGLGAALGAVALGRFLRT
jgi:hypothetical protein